MPRDEEKSGVRGSLLSGCRGCRGVGVEQFRDGGSQAVQRFKSEKENFEFHTVSHRKPVKIMQNLGDMCRTLDMSEYSGSRVLNMELADRPIRSALIKTFIVIS